MSVEIAQEELFGAIILFKESVLAKAENELEIDLKKTSIK